MASHLPVYARQNAQASPRAAIRTDGAYYERNGWMLRECDRAGRQIAKGRLGRHSKRFAKDHLFKMATSFESLRAALEHIERYGGPAPGPDGTTVDSLAKKEWWKELRSISKELKQGTWRPGPLRAVEIPKASGVRVLRIENVSDRIVARALLNVAGRLTDPGFSRNSYGYRPGLSPWHALAAAKALGEADRKLVWRKRDIAGAYDALPRGFLAQLVRDSLPNEDLARLVNLFVERPGTEWEEKGVGVPQGSSLSPWLLNLFMDTALDKPYVEARMPCAMIRFADDHLLAARRPEDLEDASAFMDEAMGAHSVEFSQEKEESGDLAVGETVNYLGLDAYVEEEEVCYDVAEDTWTDLKRRSEEECQEAVQLQEDEEERRERALSLAANWMRYLAPTEGKLRNNGNLASEAAHILTPNMHANIVDDRGLIHAILQEQVEEWRQTVELARSMHEGASRSADA